MREATTTFSDRPDGGKPFPYLLTPTGGTYILRGRARLPEHARPPAQFIGGSLRWQPLEADVWRFEAHARANTPGDSTIPVVNVAGQLGTSEIELVHRSVMDALWAAGCRAARVDAYTWEADDDGAYLLNGDLVMPDCTDECEVIDDTPRRVVSRGDLADTLECLRAVFGEALHVGAWERSPGGNLIAELRLGHVDVEAQEVAR